MPGQLLGNDQPYISSAEGGNEGHLIGMEVGLLVLRVLEMTARNNSARNYFAQET